MKTRRRIESFLPYDEERIVRHLEKMAGKGWLLAGINQFFWIYRRIEPSDLKFSVTWCSRVSEYAPGPTEEQQMLWDYCKDAGWTLAAQFDQMQILYTKDEAPMPVETDEVVKLGLIHQAMKNTYIPGILAGSCPVVVFFIQSVGRMLDQSAIQFLYPLNWLYPSATGVLTCHYVAKLLEYYCWYRKSARSVENGGKCARTGGWLSMSRIFLIIGVILLLWMSFLVFGKNSWIALMLICAALLFAAVIEGLKKLFGRMGLPKEMSIAFTVIITLILFVAAVYGYIKWVILI